jgi:hypothetical protein
MGFANKDGDEPMRRTLFPIVLALIARGLLPASLAQSADANAAPLTMDKLETELAKLREIFTSVDALPDAGTRWVEVQTVFDHATTWHPGWLQHESRSEIKLLTDDGGSRTFDRRKLAAKKPLAEFTWTDARAVRNGDFAAYCRGFLTRKKEPSKRDPGDFDVYDFERELGEANAAVVDSARLACWAKMTGHAKLARQLLQRAADKLQERLAQYVGMPFKGELHQFVADRAFPQLPDNEARTELWDDGEPNKLRHNDLRWNRALAKIPYREDHEAIVRRIRQLESLIVEDDAWKEPSKATIAKMDVHQKAAYWLYHLRNLKVQQCSDPGICRILPDSFWPLTETPEASKKDAPDPATALVSLGYDILPQLIEHLDDDRPTRCLGFWRSYALDSYYSLAYGDCCLQIFEAISLHSLCDGTRIGPYPIKQGQGKKCKELAQQWWRDFQRNGEKQILIEAVARGDCDSCNNAERLVKKYPQEAFTALRDGILAARNDDDRRRLLIGMRRLKDDRVAPFLQEEAHSPRLLNRRGR